jgi:hypothetical protein
VHAIIIFDEMQNGAIWGHFRVSYNIESSTILMTDRQEYLKIVKNVLFVSWQIRTLPLLCTSPLQNLGVTFLAAICVLTIFFGLDKCFFFDDCLKAVRWYCISGPLSPGRETVLTLVVAFLLMVETLHSCKIEIDL